MARDRLKAEHLQSICKVFEQLVCQLHCERHCERHCLVLKHCIFLPNPYSSRKLPTCLLGIGTVTERLTKCFGAAADVCGVFFRDVCTSSAGVERINLTRTGQRPASLIRDCLHPSKSTHPNLSKCIHQIHVSMRLHPKPISQPFLHLPLNSPLPCQVDIKVDHIK